MLAGLGGGGMDPQKSLQLANMALNVGVNVTGDKEIAGLGTTVGEAFDKMTESVGHFKAGIKSTEENVKQFSTNIGANLIRTAKDATYFYAETEKMSTALRVMGRNSAQSAESLKAVVGKVKDLGVTSRDAIESVRSLLQVRLDPKLAISMAEAARNIGVFARGTSDAMDRINIAMQTTSTEILQTIGLSENASQVFARYARQINVSASSLSEAQKRQAILNYAVSEGKKLTGAYEESMKDAGKILSSMSRLTDEYANAVGERFVPILRSQLEIQKNLYETFEKLNPAIQSFIVYTGAAAGKVAEMIPKFTQWGAAGAQLLSTFIPGQLLSSFLAFRGILSMVAQTAGPSAAKSLQFVSEKLVSLTGASHPAVKVLDSLIKKVETGRLAFNAFGKDVDILTASISDLALLGGQAAWTSIAGKVAGADINSKSGLAVLGGIVDGSLAGEKFGMTQALAMKAMGIADFDNAERKLQDTWVSVSEQRKSFSEYFKEGTDYVGDKANRKSFLKESVGEKQSKDVLDKMGEMDALLATALADRAFTGTRVGETGLTAEDHQKRLIFEGKQAELQKKTKELHALENDFYDIDPNTGNKAFKTGLKTTEEEAKTLIGMARDELKSAAVGVAAEGAVEGVTSAKTTKEVIKEVMGGTVSESAGKIISGFMDKMGNGLKWVMEGMISPLTKLQELGKMLSGSFAAQLGVAGAALAALAFVTYKLWDAFKEREATLKKEQEVKKSEEAIAESEVQRKKLEEEYKRLGLDPTKYKDDLDKAQAQYLVSSSPLLGDAYEDVFFQRVRLEAIQKNLQPSNRLNVLNKLKDMLQGDITGKQRDIYNKINPFAVDYNDPANGLSGENKKIYQQMLNNALSGVSPEDSARVQIPYKAKDRGYFFTNEELQNPEVRNNSKNKDLIKLQEEVAKSSKELAERFSRLSFVSSELAVTTERERYAREFLLDQQRANVQIAEFDTRKKDLYSIQTDVNRENVSRAFWEMNRKYSGLDVFAPGPRIITRDKIINNTENPNYDPIKDSPTTKTKEKVSELRVVEERLANLDKVYKGNLIAEEAARKNAEGWTSWKGQQNPEQYGKTRDEAVQKLEKAVAATAATFNEINTASDKRLSLLLEPIKYQERVAQTAQGLRQVTRDYSLNIGGINLKTYRDQVASEVPSLSRGMTADDMAIAYTKKKQEVFELDRRLFNQQVQNLTFLRQTHRLSLHEYLKIVEQIQHVDKETYRQKISLIKQTKEELNAYYARERELVESAYQRERSYLQLQRDLLVAKNNLIAGKFVAGNPNDLTQSIQAKRAVQEDNIKLSEENLKAKEKEIKHQEDRAKREAERLSTTGREAWPAIKRQGEEKISQAREELKLAQESLGIAKKKVEIAGKNLKEQGDKLSQKQINRVMDGKTKDDKKTAQGLTELYTAPADIAATIQVRAARDSAIAKQGEAYKRVQDAEARLKRVENEAREKNKELATTDRESLQQERKRTSEEYKTRIQNLKAEAEQAKVQLEAQKNALEATRHNEAMVAFNRELQNMMNSAGKFAELKLAVIKKILEEYNKGKLKLTAEEVQNIENTRASAAKEVVQSRISAMTSLRDALKQLRGDDLKSELEAIDMQKKEYILMTKDRVSAELWARESIKKIREKYSGAMGYKAFKTEDFFNTVGSFSQTSTTVFDNAIKRLDRGIFENETRMMNIKANVVNMSVGSIPGYRNMGGGRWAPDYVYEKMQNYPNADREGQVFEDTSVAPSPSERAPEDVNSILRPEDKKEGKVAPVRYGKMQTDPETGRVYQERLAPEEQPSSGPVSQNITVHVVGMVKSPTGTPIGAFRQVQTAINSISTGDIHGFGLGLG